MSLMGEVLELIIFLPPYFYICDSDIITLKFSCDIMKVQVQGFRKMFDFFNQPGSFGDLRGLNKTVNNSPERCMTDNIPTERGLKCVTRISLEQHPTLITAQTYHP